MLDKFDRNKLDAKDIAKFTKMLDPALKAAGVTDKDVKRLAEQYGIDLSVATGWFDLLEILRAKQFGSPTGNFADELSSLTESFGVLGTEDEDDKIKAFRDFVKTRVPILFDALSGDLSTKEGRDAATQKLRDIYNMSLAAKLTPDQYGVAAPGQFRQIIGTLVQLLGGGDGLLANKQPLTAASTTSAGRAAQPSALTTSAQPNGGGGGSFGGGGDVFGGASVTPSVDLLGSISTAGLPATASSYVGTLVQGDINITNNIQQRADEDGEALADRISRVMGKRLALQNAALGVRT